ncbi:ABC transporter ATP-binding protein [Allopusillimonas ginsengisoli]|uniref:ABC transporter ATP-binding protein n=1 Tax=Allopusillimonas ginsengisoli TaxID=453575 RepID=UPI0010C21785|nr:ABC transporter ATP-binding protein [Allopusillimonas ginsengisoli]
MSEYAVELRGIQKRYGSVTAVESMDMSVNESEFLSFLGPSGCGKTTTLRMIAGLEAPTAGDIYIKGRRMNDVPVHKRNIGIVFQNYALFPHRNVRDNVAFGLRFRGSNKAETAKRVADALQLVQLENMSERYPSELSGGQQQRVALARAIVIKPDLLLLDEPLSALDANLRQDMRVELKQIQKETGITTLFITHDQSEALAMSDRIAVMSRGRVEQLGTPQAIYNQPRSHFCATFIGNANVMQGKVTGGVPGNWSVETDGHAWQSASMDHWSSGDPVAVVIRAEYLRWCDEGPDETRTNRMQAIVRAVDYLGMSARYIVRTTHGQKLELVSPAVGSPLEVGMTKNISVDGQNVILLPADVACL